MPHISLTDCTADTRSKLKKPIHLGGPVPAMRVHVCAGMWVFVRVRVYGCVSTRGAGNVCCLRTCVHACACVRMFSIRFSRFRGLLIPFQVLEKNPNLCNPEAPHKPREWGYSGLRLKEVVSSDSGAKQGQRCVLHMLIAENGPTP